MSDQNWACISTRFPPSSSGIEAVGKTVVVFVPYYFSAGLCPRKYWISIIALLSSLGCIWNGHFFVSKQLSFTQRFVVDLHTELTIEPIVENVIYRKKHRKRDGTQFARRLKGRLVGVHVCLRHRPIAAANASRLTAVCSGMVRATNTKEGLYEWPSLESFLFYPFIQLDQQNTTTMSKKAASMAGLSEEKVADLKEAFAMFDINGDGRLGHFRRVSLLRECLPRSFDPRACQICCCPFV